MDSRTRLFLARVRDQVLRPAITVEPADTCRTVLSRMRKGRASAAIVVARGKPLGIVTEQDVVRRPAFLAGRDTPIERVMTTPVETIHRDELLYAAIARMRRRSLRHMPVTDDAGAVLGLIELHDALTEGLAGTVELIDILTHEDSIGGLHAIKAAQVETARVLFAGGTAATEIQSLLTEINLDIHRRLVRLLTAQLTQEGLGEPPVPFAVIVMGSGGRGESFLYPDQDNGFVVEGEGDLSPAIDAYFLALAKRMTEALDTIGFPLCKGDVMATNPAWRRTLGGWRAQVLDWVTHRQDAKTLLADIFFDFRVAAGEADLGVALRTRVMQLIAEHPGFLRQMYRIEADHGVALGLFNRLATDRRDGEDTIDLKLHGTLPLVEGVRLYALRAGIAETSTAARMERLRAAGVLSADEHDYLSGAFAHITLILLRRQIEDYVAGRTVGARVDPRTLSERERDILVDSLKAIREFRARLRADFAGELL